MTSQALDPERREIQSLQIARGLAALSVLLFHTETVLGSPLYLGHAILPIFTPGRAGVELFFVLSGFVISLAHHADFNQSGATRRFIWKRFRRVYPPLWFALIAVLPVFLFASTSISATGKINATNIALAFLVAPAPYETLLWVEWTLRREVFFYLIFALSLWRPAIGGPIFLAWMASTLIFGAFVTSFPASFVVSPDNTLFGLGVLIAALYLRAKIWRPAILRGAGAVIFGATWALNMQGVLTNDYRSIWPYGAGAALMLIGAADLERRRPFRAPKIMMFLGEASYSIYLVHLPAVSVMSKLSVRASRAGAPDLALFAATAIGALVVGSLFHLAVEKPFLRLLSPRRADRAAEPG